MRLIVGLGNPGSEYAKTRHNAGFMVLHRLSERHMLAGPKSKFQGQVIEDRIGSQRVALLAPMTYMNRSGRSVIEALTFYKLTPSDLMVIVDDTALPCGKIRLRGSGSAGGHNGLADIERTLGTRDYPRLRIGVDSPGPVPLKDYVLQRFTDEQSQRLRPALDAACDCIEAWLLEDLDRVMSRFNGEA